MLGVLVPAVSGISNGYEQIVVHGARWVVTNCASPN